MGKRDGGKGRKNVVGSKGLGEDGEGVKRGQGGELTCRAKTYSPTKQRKHKSAGSPREDSRDGVRTLVIAIVTM
jgi:hypothetical protein